MLRVDTCIAASWALLLLAVGGSTPGTTARPQKPARDAPSGGGSGSGSGGTSFPPHGTFLAPTRRDTQCKNCPYERCLNALVLTNGTDIEYSCYTVGEPVNLEQYGKTPENVGELTFNRTWLRHTYGLQLGDFCYVSPHDLPTAEIDCPSPLLPPPIHTDARKTTSASPTAATSRSSTSTCPRCRCARGSTPSACCARTATARASPSTRPTPPSRPTASSTTAGARSRPCSPRARPRTSALQTGTASCRSRR